jgi:DNA-directed RNA polymerase specialized sigma24 family protein
LSDKRGGGVTILGLEAIVEPARSPGIDVLVIDEALDQLMSVDARLCRVVELRFFAGLNIEETAAALELSTATVDRDWAMAKAWLFQRLSPRS